MSCNACAKREAWETEDLTREYANSAIRDLDGTALRAFANQRGPDAPVFTWFYAPWCKQCKLIRPAVEEAAQESGDIAYAKLDCVADVDAKNFYGVTSYPSFKVLRGSRHRWVEIPRNRTTQVIAELAASEAQGPFVWAHSLAELEKQLYQQVPPGTNKMDAVGKGEAVALALLSSPTGAAAQAFTALAAGCSARLSPMPYVAITDATLLEAAGLPPMQPDELAVVKLFAEPASAPEVEQTVPRVEVRPLLGAAADGSFDEAAEEATCKWALAHRLPMLVDFDEDPYWGKRADKIHFVRMHALLFLSPPHAELAGVVRAAATRFERGTMIVMQFMVSDMDTSSKPLLTRYGVNSVLDTPRLVFLDMRKDTKENRQLVYKAPIITEQGIVDFLQGVGLEALDGMATAVKDEL